ncbi:MAG: pyrroline-5-carboxylate reductase [Gammaproteobacteria bacterium]|nr:pyrroline-5-carboxylate reductase [Gammaproteobacteria bacterium]
MQNLKQIGFIGGGNMARALIGGLYASGTPIHSVFCHEPDPQRRSELLREYPLQIVDSNQGIIDQCGTVVFAVKPQALQSVARALLIPSLDRAPLFITIAAGIRTTSLQHWLRGAYPIVRAMPNTPALVRAGASGIYATANTSPQQRETAESILRAVGVALWLDQEEQLDAVTALSGSGPAYFFYVMEALERAAISLGLPAETARLLTIETAFGSAKLALEIKESPHTLRQRVTSPGGTTESAIGVLEAHHFIQLFHQALTAARDRAVELSQQMEH